MVDYVMASSTKVQAHDQHEFLEFSEVKALEGLLNTKNQ